MTELIMQESVPAARSDWLRIVLPVPLFVVTALFFFFFFLSHQNCIIKVSCYGNHLLFHCS